jgi:hypothetical protein
VQSFSVFLLGYPTTCYFHTESRSADFASPVSAVLRYLLAEIQLERSETMRALTYGEAVSLDGFLAGMDGSLDWLHFSKDVQQVMADYWKDLDTIVMGRKTYEVSVANNPKKSNGAKRTEPTMRTFVFSRTLKRDRRPRRSTGGERRGRVRPTSQTRTREGHLLHGRWRIGAITFSCRAGGQNRPKHPSDSSRLRHIHVPRFWTSNKTDTHRMPYARRWLHPRKL